MGYCKVSKQVRIVYSIVLSVLIFTTSYLAHSANKHPSGCKPRTFQAVSFTVCTFDAARDDIRMFHSRPNGTAHHHFSSLRHFLKTRGDILRFAMNAGMHHTDRAPVGLYIENGVKIRALNTQTGPGNFFLKPNGVFYLRDGKAGVLATRRYVKSKARLSVRHATQSGPVLVTDGKLHPAFLATSQSRFKRNGVGVMADGRTVHFVISETPVNFYTFARFFRDVVGTPNALYLDGYVSKLYAPQLKREDRGSAMGPIVGVVEGMTKQKHGTN